MTKRIKLIINPNADMGNAWRHASALKHIAEAYNADWAGTVYPTHATEIAKQAAEDGYDVIVALGGDGTVHEVVNGIMSADVKKRPALGVVPFGSGNDFAHNIGVPKDPEKALVGLFNGTSKRLDIALIEDDRGRKEYWDNTVNMGFGGAVTIFSHKISWLRGFLMYLTAVLQTIFTKYIILDSQVKTESEEINKKVMMIAVNNGPREGGGFVTGPDARMDDGVMDFSLVEAVSRPMMLYMLPFFMQGTQAAFKQVSFHTFKTLHIKTDKPMWIHTDGEVFAGFEHDVREIKMTVFPGALEVLIPNN
jgi:YegS/Rv2252/BmrU family lipid kinase